VDFYLQSILEKHQKCGLNKRPLKGFCAVNLVACYRNSKHTHTLRWILRMARHQSTARPRNVEPAKHELPRVSMRSLKSPL